MSNANLNPDLMLQQLISGAGTPNPWFNIANQFLPRNMHDVIRWSRYITLHSPTVTEVIRKLCTYPITEFIVHTPDEKIRARYEEVFESFKLKQTLQDVGFDYFTLGNVFISVYFPIHRTLTCPNCSTTYSARSAGFAVFKKFQFEGTCPTCYSNVKLKVNDAKSLNLDEMNIIRWNPENIAVSHNVITGECEYYYKIPNDVKSKILRGDRLYVDTVPWSFIEAVKNNQDFKFDRSNIFHLKNLSTGAVVEGCSIPPLISLYSLVFYQAMLRKANEAIAAEHMAPLRVVFPKQTSANADPVVMMSLKNFTNNMQDAVRKHKKDLNYFLIAPGEVGYLPLGGEGKNLLVSQEIEQAEESILMSLGVSRELLSGSTNWTSSDVGLRMLSNTLLGYTTQIEKLIDWILAKTCAYLTFTKVEVKLSPFRLTDDEGLKTNLVQLLQANQISPTTAYESMGIDYNKELIRIKDDAVAKAKLDVEIRFEVDQATFMAAKKAGDKLDKNNEYQAMIAQAQSVVDSMVGADSATVHKALGDLKITNYPMYVMVDKIMRDRVEDQASLTGVSVGDEQAAEAAAQEKTDGPKPPKKSE